MPVDRRDLRRRLFSLASAQGGYFTAAQAKDVGYTYPAQAHHASTGNWIRVDRGLFRLGEWVPGLHDHFARWSLWSKGRAVISHETALGVHDIGEFEASKMLTAAASVIGSEPAAIQLRYLQTLTEIAAEKNSTIVFPIPIEILSLIPNVLSRLNAGNDRSGGGDLPDDSTLASLDTLPVPSSAGSLPQGESSLSDPNDEEMKERLAERSRFLEGDVDASTDEEPLPDR